MNAVLEDYNIGDLDLDWCDVVDILSVQIKHQFICEGRYNSDMIIVTDSHPSLDNYYNEDYYIQKQKNIACTSLEDISQF